MKRKEAVELYAVLRELRNGAMSKEALTAFILMRMKLKIVYDEFEKARQEISEQTRPDGFQDGDDVSEWNAAFAPVMDKWLDEQIESIETNVLTAEDFVELISKTEMTGGVQDMLFERVVKF